LRGRYEQGPAPRRCCVDHVSRKKMGCVSALIALGSNPHDIRLTLVGTCALIFGMGAALTGLVFRVTEDMP
jgi:hypothetical protein